MIAVHVEFRIKPGKRETFLDWKRREGELQLVAPGFVKRHMHADRADDHHFFYISYWQNEDIMHAFGQTDAFNAAMKASGLEPGDGDRVMTYVTEVFEERGTKPELAG